MSRVFTFFFYFYTGVSCELSRVIREIFAGISRRVSRRAALYQLIYLLFVYLFKSQFHTCLRWSYFRCLTKWDVLLRCSACSSNVIAGRCMFMCIAHVRAVYIVLRLDDRCLRARSGSNLSSVQTRLEFDRSSGKSALMGPFSYPSARYVAFKRLAWRI